MNGTLSQKGGFFFFTWGGAGAGQGICSVHRKYMSTNLKRKNFIKTAKQNPEEEKGRNSKELRREEGDSARNTAHSGSPVLSFSPFSR